MSKTLVLFDFDGTLTKHDTFNQFVFFAKGKPKAITGYFLFSPHIFLYYTKLLSGTTLKQKMTAFYFSGEKEEFLRDAGKRFIAKLESDKEFKDDLFLKLSEFKKNGDEVCIVSASLDIWIRPFCEKHQLNYLCTELLFEKGIYTGNFKTPNCNNEEKAVRIKKAYDLSEYSKIIAFGNSSGDKSMFALANETHFIK